ncbi:right-handed parallel beta-helix repeat-containing protein [Cupriavidus oxalaticus]|uniref:right-handed parallel beta-helix repeat-containing protein n=1 Tax=Cupriavidus oxalaticus TaxID=96344 RepID=UPI001F10E76F|nr:right-handed parallel beta-helix repeat-containing protein [Cupriavidus oxalaticus]
MAATEIVPVTAWAAGSSAAASETSGGDCPLLELERQRYPEATVRSALAYGLKGDGVTDEYTAFQRIAADISNRKFDRRMIVYFPAGTYYINRFVRESGADANKNKHIRYADASNFSLIGCTGAVISVKGDFHMPNDTTLNTPWWYSHTQQLNPFMMERSSNFRVSGFEVNGNVDKMTRQAPAGGKGIAESDSFGMLTSAARNYEVSHMKIHHFASDGILVGASHTADDGGRFHDIEVYNNARQGVSVIQAINLKFTHSIFRDTGFTDGAYPSHAPSAGVDVEPNWAPDTGASARTGNIVFENCRFANNRGSQFVTGGNGHTVENIRISNSEIIGRPGGFEFVVIMSVPEGIIENSYIDTATGGIYPFFREEVGSIQRVNTVLRGNTIVSSGAGIVAADLDAKVVVENNTFVSKHDPGFESFFPHITRGVVRFAGNKVNYDTRNFGKRSMISLIRVPDFRNNTLTTNRRDGHYYVGVGTGPRRADNSISDHIQIGP